MELVSLLAFVVAAAEPRVGTAEKPPAPFSDYRDQRPGLVHHIRALDLPKPFKTSSARNPPDRVRRPKDGWPKVPDGFAVTLYAEGLKNPRQIRAAPNGDLFVAESSPGRLRVLRGVSGEGKARTTEVFATGLSQPFGVAFFPPGPKPEYVYVGNTDAVVRLPYRSGELKAKGPAERVLELPSGGFLTGGGHWTRDVVFSPDGKRLFASVGSWSNNDDTDGNRRESRRAAILSAAPDGTGAAVYASGLRNPVGLAVDPATGDLWASVNERDGLGDFLPPDYITRVREGGFYGWPWYYIGGHPDPRHEGKHPELKGRVLVPDVLLEPHNASLGLTFYTGDAFPERYRGGLFAAQHGSWNRSIRTGYSVIFVPVRGGKAEGTYEDFLTGFVSSDEDVWGRPVGVAVGADGALYVTDDAGDAVWRVAPAR
ncbi:MAG: sorbosone dehydrogenase family protein [Elusimicrobia bacterium]|nr:sorbosone dehydrogenase family protein [Elusimicrobiota bacterium]